MSRLERTVEAAFIDRAAVGALAVAQKRLDRQGREPALRSPSRLALRCCMCWGRPLRFSPDRGLRSSRRGERRPVL